MTLQSSLPAASPAQPAHAPAHGPAPAPVPNGAFLSIPTPSRLPRPRRRGKLLWLLFLAIGILALGGVGLAYAVWFRGPQLRPDLVTYRVEYKDLQLKIVERGSLEAGKTYDVKCDVKTGSRGAPRSSGWWTMGRTSRRTTCSSISTTPTCRNRRRRRRSTATKPRPTRSPRSRPIPRRRSPSLSPSRPWRNGSRAIIRSNSTRRKATSSSPRRSCSSSRIGPTGWAAWSRRAT